MAAIVEQHHDERGIVLAAIASLRTTCTSCAFPAWRSRRRRSSRRLEAAGAAVLLDDRELRAGEKFADADLIGCPYRVTVGKKTLEDGAVDVLVRQTGEEQRVQLEEVDDLMSRRRRFSEQPFGETAIGLMAETGVTFRGLAAKTGLSAGYLNHIMHGNRPVPSNEILARLARALGVEPEHFLEYRVRVITERLERMPDLVDRLYKRLG